jgi:hypothetical protein
MHLCPRPRVIDASLLALTLHTNLCANALDSGQCRLRSDGFAG